MSISIFGGFWLTGPLEVLTAYSVAVDAAAVADGAPSTEHYGDLQQCPTNSAIYRYPCGTPDDYGTGPHCALDLVSMPEGATLAYIPGDDPAWIPPPLW